MYVGYNVYGTGTSKKVWGENATEFLPERWGENMEELSSNWKKHKHNGSMSAFHGGRRSCLGEKLAMMEMKFTLYFVLINFSISLDPTWKVKMTPAGPICPKMLRIKLKSLKSEEGTGYDSSSSLNTEATLRDT